ncbi:hypothetical protein [Bacillus sp. CGMCC 1.16541]|uniref:hypothetical protein n=1 Tax=Bacillus sp. CGMCC 1.16541 TaxID=2185143 RepID=UPI000D726A45|nr:hypothetical protein [Bacillus sp. CGMCC 1.16541]
MTKRFGIDIDGTVTCPTTFIPYLNESFQLDLTLDDITEYDLTPFVGVTQEELGKWFLENESHIYSNAPLAQDAKKVLSDWQAEHELFFISARHDKLLDVTKEWFTKQNLSFHHIELIGSHYKVETAKRLGVDIFFEDKHDNACDISEECQIPVILFDTPYNRDPIPKNVIRVYNWIEAKQWVNNWLLEHK